MEPLEKRMGLSHDYPSVEGSYGGSQTWFSEKVIYQGGCGLVAAGDLLLYLGMYRKGCRTEEVHRLSGIDGSLSKAPYQKYLKQLKRRYFPFMTRFGLPYWALAVGVNRYFRKNGISLKAGWGLAPWKMKLRMEEMLEQDIPVIFAIGPNFPPVIRKGKLNLYVRKPDGEFQWAARTRAHYVVATGMKEGKVQISSWGKTYFVDWEEYKTYVRRYSNYFMSNLFYIYKK